MGAAEHIRAAEETAQTGRPSTEADAPAKSQQ